MNEWTGLQTMCFANTDELDVTIIWTQNFKFKAFRSEAEFATSQSQYSIFTSRYCVSLEGDYQSEDDILHTIVSPMM